IRIAAYQFTKYVEVMMGRRVTLAFAGALVLAGAFGLCDQRITVQPPAAASSATPADYARWRGEMKNWGRWGDSDTRGASNLITAAKIQSAARLRQSPRCRVPAHHRT